MNAHRSDRAHAEIVSVNPARAAAHPGVKQVFTDEDAVRHRHRRKCWNVRTDPGTTP